MRITRALPLMFAAVAMIACGSSKKTGTPDAKGSGSIDAPGGTVDAPGGTPDAAAAVTVDWNAAVCSQQTACALSGDECLSDGTSQSGFCGTQCGPTTQTMTPGTDYDTNCSSHYKGTGGTPACLFYSGTGTNGDQPPFTWYCAVACGTYMNMNLGTCPTGLTCKNFSGQTYGACQP